jgi:uncharacterized protein involved in exopolysaccharide biosynthesis
MKDQEFTPRASLERAFQGWWLIVILTTLGGIAGWAFHYLRPPLYEATAVMTITMDFQKVKLTQYQQDYAFNAAGAIANSTAVKNTIIADATIRGFPMDGNHLPEQLFLERRQSVWEFHIRNRDPHTAAKLANLWADNTTAALNVGLSHAMRADQIQKQIDSITSGSPGLGVETQTALKNLSSELLLEKQLSLGLISVLKFSLTGTATAPRNPALFNLAKLVLAGACIGFVISLWAASNLKVYHRG